MLDRQFHVAGIVLVHLVLAGVIERADGHRAFRVGEGDGVVGIVAHPGAGSDGDLAEELVQVDIGVALLVHGRLEQAVPVLAVDTAVVDAGAGGVAVVHDPVQGELQVVVVLGGGAEALVTIPAPALDRRFHERAATPLGAGTAPHAGGGDGILAQDGLGELRHVDGIGAGLARGRRDGDGRSPAREVHGPAALDVRRGLVGEIQGFHLHMGHVAHEVGGQLDRNRTGALVHVLHLGQARLAGELDVQDAAVMIPAALLHRVPGGLRAGAQQHESAHGDEYDIAFHGYLMLGLRSVSMDGMG